MAEASEGDIYGEVYTITALPPEFMFQIGCIIVAWAGFETGVQNAVYMAAGVNSRIGRAVFREPSASERLDMIGDLLSVRGVSYDKAVLKNLRIETERLRIQRNLLAHGVWIQAGDEFRVQNKTGSLGQEYTSELKRRRVYPEFKTYTIPTLIGIGASIMKLWRTDFVDFVNTTRLRKVPPEGPTPQGR